MKQIVLASNNLGKIEEFNHICNKFDIEIIPQSTFNVPEIDEPYGTFIENALHKARNCSKYTHLPVIADDSGVCVEALHGEPGVLSARYAGNSRESNANNKKLIYELTVHNNKKAYYYCVLVFIRHLSDPQPIVADGVLHGEIINTPRGTNGFGYDPHMFLKELNKTVAELTQNEKNAISHRLKAIINMIINLDKNNL